MHTLIVARIDITLVFKYARRILCVMRFFDVDLMEESADH